MYQDILTFWFVEIDPLRWWEKDEAFDQLIAQRFLQVHTQASRCELYHWRADPKGRLAEIIVLDQFSRNIYRGRPDAFAQDTVALALAQEAIRLNAQAGLSPAEKNFLYLPFMHSESLAIHDLALELYRESGLEENLDFEIRHRDIIKRFGRYPHRNEILGRTSTAEEREFLQQPDSGF